MVFVNDSADNLDATRGHFNTMQALRKLGHITPSCNTVLEPLSAMMTYPMRHRVSNHFTRVSVGNISLEPTDIGQFDTSAMVGAASILAEAFMDAIVWNGTSGSWNGVQVDREMCDAIMSATGVAATSSTLAQLDALAHFGVSKIGLAVPYLDDVTEKIIATYTAEGYDVASHANLGIFVGRDMANVPLAEIRQLLRDANSDEVECLVVVCTGLPAALVVDEMEKELGKPIFDSVAVTLWKGMELVGLESTASGWGALLEGDDAVASLIEPRGSQFSTR